MKFVLGAKLGMTQVWENGKATPVTVVEVAPNTVIRVKTVDSDGYEAVQIGAGVSKRITKAQKGQFKDLGNFRWVREFRIIGSEAKAGDRLDVSLFQPGDIVKVSGVSKGKGFQGAVKRHGFSGMPSSHGHTSVKRHIGSIGQRFPQHTLKGKRMAGRMGGDSISVRGLKVIHVDAEEGLLAIKGSVPGNRGGLLAIRSLS